MTRSRRQSPPRTLVAAAALAGVLLGAMLARAADEIPMYSKVGKYQAPHPQNRRIGYLSWNLGATGARGWFYGFNNNTHDSREIVIKSVEMGSPADGILKRYDVITGVAGKPFTSDARQAFGEALTEAERPVNKGVLKLLRWRDGKTTEVAVQLPLIGEYSATSPFDCPKSEKILAAAASYLVDHMPVEGFEPNVGGALNGLLLLATGEAKYLDHVRRTAYRFAPPDLTLAKPPAMKNWPYSYALLLLAEYHLATGDDGVLPAMKLYAKRLCDGQGMPGAWGHSAADNRTILGYGALNQVGLVCFMSLTLAKECGLAVDEAVLERSTLFFGKYAGIGGIPYGDHPPVINTNAANGKNALAAVAFGVLGQKRMAGWFSHLVASSAPERELGHTGNFFGYAWGGPGAAFSGPKALAAFLKPQRWYYDMFRRWDGSLLAQSLPQTREGDLCVSSYISSGPVWNTGGYALTYAIPRRQLRILGAPRASAGRAAGRQTESIKLTLAAIAADLSAGDLYRAQCRAAGLKPILPTDDKRLLADCEARCADPANAKLLETGKEYYQLARKVVMARDKTFMRFGPAIVIDAKSRKAMEAIAANPDAGLYTKLAAKQLADHPGEPAENWVTLLASERRAEARRQAIKNAKWWERPPIADVSNPQKLTCRFYPFGKSLPGEPATKPASPAAPAGWEKLGFDDAAWATASGPVGSTAACVAKWHTTDGLFRVAFNVDDPARFARLRVDCLASKEADIYLNGEKVLAIGPESTRDPDGYCHYELKNNVMERVRNGSNVLAIHVRSSGDCAFDISLDAMLRAGR